MRVGLRLHSANEAQQGCCLGGCLQAALPDRLATMGSRMSPSSVTAQLRQCWSSEMGKQSMLRGATCEASHAALGARRGSAHTCATCCQTSNPCGCGWRRGQAHLCRLVARLPPLPLCRLAETALHRSEFRR